MKPPKQISPLIKGSELLTSDLSQQVNGFSVLEILAVLGIVVLIAALLFPLFAPARRKAQDTSCLTNLQQLSHALTMYTTDYDGSYPLMVTGAIVDHEVAEEAKGWADLIQPYLREKEFPVCPLRQWLDTLPERAKRMGDFSGYSCNFYLNRAVGTKRNYFQEGRKEVSFAYPACTLTLLEARAGITELPCPDMIHSREDLNNIAGYRLADSQIDAFLQQTPGALRHHGGANYAFADGHVKWFKPEQLRTDKKSDGINPGFGL